MHRVGLLVSQEQFPAMVGVPLVLIGVMAVFAPLGLQNQELSRLDEDMAWLLTLPISADSISLMKVSARTFLNIYAWVTGFPFLMALWWHEGARWSAPILAFLYFVPFFVFFLESF